ncbi:beta-galactosidase [Coraliomargarita parva]|uniref:beta-galactosidase n=1 Tax=Coraliomargarita parva TaxID=3014050 RepID=UPI0022B2FB0B|nr:beta-galactosidase [Coraliomargarita parva]
MIQRPFVTFFGCAAVGLLPFLTGCTPELDSHIEARLESKELRGYGEVAGQQETNLYGSVFKITADSVEHAQLTQSKYLSDLQVLPGVSSSTLAVGSTDVTAYQVDGQGYIAALQKGSEVWIFSSDTKEALASNIDGMAGKVANWNSVAQAEVPMWLNRWDKFGFRHYYRAWALPNDSDPQEYDYAKEFAFAEKNERNGFVFWESLNPIDTAEGLTNSAYIQYARDAAREKRLPVGVNIMVGGRGNGWLFNPYRESTQMPMPHYSGSFKKPADNYLGKQGFTSWNAFDFNDVQLGLLQNVIKDYIANDPNVTTILEPHGELRHGEQDIFVEFGPAADAGFRQYLGEKYGDIDSVNDRWGTHYGSFEEVHVPEVASFLGWGDDALDLAGTWKVNYEPLPEGVRLGYGDNTRIYSKVVKTLGAPKAWFAEDFDDSSWLEFEAPATDDILFIQQRPAVIRQTIDVPANWLADKKQVWLYVWDLNRGAGDLAKAYLNGEFVGEDTLVHPRPHWMALEVSDAIRAGENQLSLRLPKAMIAYRIYLSPAAPSYYPNLGKGQNALWVDFVDWNEWSRVETARRSMDMIRQVAPNRPITLMAPDGYASSIVDLARDYGGNFHNTGYMGAFYADYLPSMMRGAGLPFSLEPGGPAKDLEGFKKHLGLYTSEGLQGVDYFIHIGSIMWPDDIREFFETKLKLFKLFGKYHGVKTDVAAFISSRNNAYTSYPWPKDYNKNLKSGYWMWNPLSYLRGLYAGDGLSESSFDAGDAKKYKVILDSNTSIMDESMLEDIERYVLEGGVYVTGPQTGRHSPTEPDTWPISRLTGFKVTYIDQLDEQRGHALTSRKVHPAEGQDVYSGDWTYANGNGLTLEPVAEDVVPLLLWEDGSIAVGMRPLGKGWIIQLGAKFVTTKYNDRLDHRTNVEDPKVRATRALYSQILEWQKVPQVDVAWEPKNELVRARHYETNNGLYDVWTVWNPSDSDTIEGSLRIKSVGADSAYRVVDGQQVALVDGRIELELAPYETQVFLTPRHQLPTAALKWFELQRSWWRSTVEISDTNYQDLGQLKFNIVDLQDDWAFLPLDEGVSVEPMVQPGFDDASWTRKKFDVWSLQPGYESVKHALLRKTFTVPEDWVNGEIELWAHAWYQSTFVGDARLWLDGKLFQDWTSNGIAAANPFGSLKPGSRHTLAVEIKSDSKVAGIRGSVWIRYNPAPLDTIDLSGEWELSPDTMALDKMIKLPGKYAGMSLWREVEVPLAFDGKRVLFSMQRTGSLMGIMINGQWLRRFHHQIGYEIELDITPWIRFGESNRIEAVSMNGPTHGEVKSVQLRIEEPVAHGK